MVEPNVQLRASREATSSRAIATERMSRAELAEAVNLHLWETRRERYDLDAHTIARYERGAVRWPSAHYREGFRAVLGRTDAELGFRPTRRGATSSPTSASWPTAAATSPFGEVDLGGSSADYLARTTIETPLPTRIGWTEVEHIKAATRAFAMSENQFGGGLSCEAAAAQLRWASGLLEARADNDVRRATLEALGNLSSVVAFSAFDIAEYEAADRCFKYSLWCAEQGESWVLRGNTLAEMSRKAAYLGDLDEALSLIEFAQVRADRLSATACAMLWTVRARLLAITGRYEEAYADVGRADEHFAAHEPAVDPPWLCYYDEAEHQGSTGKALVPVALKSNRPELAAPRLESAIRLQDINYPRSRAFSRTRLATLNMAVGDPHQAAIIGRHALQDAVPLRSHRIVSELRGLARSAEQHDRISDVAELRHDITSLALPRS